MISFFTAYMTRLMRWPLFLGALVSLSAAASPHTDIGVKAQSFGGAFRAVADAEEIIFYNPAGLIKHRRTGSDFFYQVATDDRFHRLGIAVADTQTTSWGLGLGYTAGIDKKSDRAVDHSLYLALAMPLVTDMFALGTSFSYFYDQAIITDPYSHFFNMDVAFMVNAPLGMSFAVVADHILSPKGREKALGLSVAGAFDLEQVIKEAPLIISLDWLMNDVKNDDNLDHIFAAGMQYKALSVMPLRFGFKSALKNNENFFSFGTGFITDSFSIDGVWQQHLTIGKIRHFGVSLGLRI
jgi:hypothetical protein